MDRLRSLTWEAEGNIRIGQSNISHSVILVYPDPKNRSNMLVEAISRHVCMLLAGELFKQGFEEIARTYRMFRDINPLSVGAGWMFEYYCHRMLSEKHSRKINLLPLTKVSNSHRKRGTFKLCRPDGSQGQLFTITRRQRHHLDSKEFSDEKYFSPCGSTKLAYEVVDQSIYLFQMTRQGHALPSSLVYSSWNNMPAIGLLFILLVPKERELGDVYLAVPEEAYDKATFYMSIINMSMDDVLLAVLSSFSFLVFS